MFKSYIYSWKHFADFKGRTNRFTYWTFVLENIIIQLLIYLFAALLLFLTDEENILYILVDKLKIVYQFVILIPSLSICVRRLHDIDKSGWNYLLGCLTLGILLIVWFCRKGNPNNNKWGSPQESLDNNTKNEYQKENTQQQQYTEPKQSFTENPHKTQYSSYATPRNEQTSTQADTPHQQNQAQGNSNGEINQQEKANRPQEGINNNTTNEYQKEYTQQQQYQSEPKQSVTGNPHKTQYSSYIRTNGKQMTTDQEDTFQQVYLELRSFRSYRYAWEHFADFKGRTNRFTFWTFMLENLIMLILIYIIMPEPDYRHGTGTIYEIRNKLHIICTNLDTIYSLVILIPSLSICVRRLHDIDKSGWNYLLGCLTLGILNIVWFCKNGNPNNNKWGSPQVSLEKGEEILTESVKEEQENLPEKWDDGAYLVAVTYELKHLIYTVQIDEDVYDIDDFIYEMKKEKAKKELIHNLNDSDDGLLVAALKAAKANYVMRYIGKQSRKSYDVIVKHEEL